MRRIIGVTGGIASGKSNVCSIISNLGYPVIDCDKLSKELSVKGGLVYNAMVNALGDKYLLEDGNLDRKKIAKLIFNDAEARALIDRATHPIIIDELKKRINDIEDGLVFVEAPLLFEAKLNEICDKVICVFLNKKYQVERLMARDGIDEDYALAKIHSQMDLYMKKELADFVVNSKGTFDETNAQVLGIIEEIKGVSHYGSN